MRVRRTCEGRGYRGEGRRGGEEGGRVRAKSTEVRLEEREREDV